MGGNSQGEIGGSPPEPGSVADLVALVSETVGRHFKCCICLSTFNDPVMLPCNHAMCRPCALQALKQKQRCPECLNSIPNLRTAQGRNAWIADMVDSLRNCLNEVGASLTQHAPVPVMYRNAKPLSPRGLARARARERASASDRPVPPSPPEPPSCGATASRSESASRNRRSDGMERRRLPRTLQPERQPAPGVPSRGRGRPRREICRGRSQSRPPPLRGRRMHSPAPLDTQEPHSDAPLGREQLPQEPQVDAVDPVEREVQASPPSAEPFVVGDLVFVANRTWPGINKYGGVALIKAVLDPPGSRYNVKYMVTQKFERGVEACYIQRHAFVSDAVGARPRRGSKRTRDGRLGGDEDRSSVNSRPRRAAVACSPATTVGTRTPPLRPSSPGSARGNDIGELVVSGENLGGGIGQHMGAVVAECRLSMEHPVEVLGFSSVSGAGTPSSGERVQADDPRPEGSHTVSDNRATARNPNECPLNPGSAQEGMQCQTPVVVVEQHAAAQTETRAVPREQEASARESHDRRIPEQSSLDVGEALGPCAAAAAEIGRSHRRDEGNSIASSVEAPSKRARAETSTMTLPSRQDPQVPPLGVPPMGHEFINPSPIERPGASRAQSVVLTGHRSTTDSAFVSPERGSRGTAIAFSKRETGTGVDVVATPKKVGVSVVRRETDASVVGAEFQQPGTLPPGTYPPQPPQSVARVASSSPEPLEVSHVLPAPSPPKERPPATPSQVPRTTSIFKVGDVVTVQSQSSPGVNKEGGVARIVRTGPNDTYDVKYLVRQGTDKGVRLELLSRYDVDAGGSGGAPACSGSGDAHEERGSGPLDVTRTAATPGSSGGRPAMRLQRSTKGNCAPDLAAGQANAVYLNILLGDTQHPEHDLDSDLGEALDPTEGSPSVRGARRAVVAREEIAAVAATEKVCLREDNASAGGKRKADNRSARRKQDSRKDDALIEAKRATNVGDHDDPGGADGLTGKVDAHHVTCEDEVRVGRNPLDGGTPGVRGERTSRSPRIASPVVVRDAGVAPKQETDSAGSRKPLQRPPAIAKRRGQTRSVVLSTSGLTPQMTALAGDLAKSHGWKIESKYTEEVTHVVCRTATGSNRAHIRSAKFLRAVAAGKWVLNEGWLQECKRRGGSSPVQEEEFEITGDKKSNVPAAPRRSRIAHGELDRLGLFHDTVFYLWGEFGTESPPRSELEPMLMANGGIVVETLRALLSRNDGTGSGTRERRRRRIVLFQASPSAPERDARVLAKELSSGGRPSPALGGSGASRGRGREIGAGEVEILRPLWLVDSIGSFRVLAPSDVHRVSLPEVESLA